MRRLKRKRRSHQLRTARAAKGWLAALVLVNDILLRDGNAPLLQATVVDVTARKVAEAALQQSEERFRVALEDSPITVFSLDRDLRYTWIYNPRLHGQPR